MISLVMLSGGTDSTYVLARLLRQTEDEVLVHHIRLITNFNRHVPEQEASRKIVEYCKREYRGLLYTETAIDHRRMLAHGLDVVAAGFETGVVAASFNSATGKRIDRWFIGLAADDEMPRLRAKQAQDCCEANCQDIYTPELCLFPPVNFQQQVDYMGRELFDLTWSCRMPQRNGEAVVACGECSACQRRAKAQFESEASPLADEEQLEPRTWTHIIPNVPIR